MTQLDIKVEGATVIDGTGTAGGRTDLGIRDETIVALGDLSRESAGRTIHAAGRVVAPGFIDMHSHSDWRLWDNRRAESKIRQGVTTEVVGNCGFSPAPVSAEHLEDLRGFALYLPRGMDFRWRSVGEYLDAFDGEGTGLNVIQLVGHGTLRVAAMGFARRPPSAGELGLMQRMLEAAVEDGAWGLSTGLIYAPGSYATTDEIVAVARGARRRGFYASHIRGEGSTLVTAVDEAIRIGREADLPVQVSHIKAAGRPNWGQVGAALDRIDAAVADGLDVTADCYPYTASSTTLRTLLPDWALEGGIDAMLARLRDPETRQRVRRDVVSPANGQSLVDRIGWENIMVASCTRRKDAEGRRLSEVGIARGLDPLDAALELIADEDGRGYVILFQLDEQDVRRALQHPRVMVGSDGSSLAPNGPLGEGKPHPRSYGTFPRVLGEYAREQRVLSLAQAVHKMTGLPARRLGLKDRGIIRVGARADLVVFDPKLVADRATYGDPHRYPAGIEHVMVNGRLVVRDGEHTGSLPGRVLRLP
ncbi:MAG TPA: D-aminoacylase [Methylomirabilota bacterium]|nr:D-aminoacylase [Methylomirabilota bacterium]